MNWKKRTLFILAMVMFAGMLTACISGSDKSAGTAVSPTPTNIHTTSAPDLSPIPAIRQGDLKNHVVDENETAVPQTDIITIRQTSHEFIFGGQVPYCRPVLAVKRWYNNTHCHETLPGCLILSAEFSHIAGCCL